MSSDYEVGYGKPPKEHQFKPGNKAARKRRGTSRRKELSIGDVIDRALKTRRRIRRGEETLSLSVAEIMIERLIQMATTGTARDLARLIDLIEKYRPDALSDAADELAITYHRAEGSSVPLPSPDLWEKPR